MAFRENRVKILSVTAACNRTRIRYTGYAEVEASLVKYIELRRQLYNIKISAAFLSSFLRKEQIKEQRKSCQRIATSHFSAQMVG